MQLYEDKIEELNAQLDAVQTQYNTKIQQLSSNISSEQVGVRNVCTTHSFKPQKPKDLEPTTYNEIYVSRPGPACYHVRHFQKPCTALEASQRGFCRPPA